MKSKHFKLLNLGHYNLVEFTHLRDVSVFHFFKSFIEFIWVTKMKGLRKKKQTLIFVVLQF